MMLKKQGDKLMFSDQAVKKATGLDWHDWFSILDDLNWKEKGRALVESILYNVYGLSDRWLQRVLLRYEHERGIS
jgi:hypothetical protein